MISIRECTPDDLSVLQKISRDTFQDTFAHLNSKANMNSFLEEAYNLDKLKAELSNEASSFYFIYEDRELAGYLKLNESPAQTDLHDPSSLELERIYVLRDFQGKGIGRRLMDQAIEAATKRKKAYLWLGVWEKNQKALAFYKKYGFYQFGTHAFVIGEDAQNDYLLRKDLD